jgi:hypothetical protein
VCLENSAVALENQGLGRMKAREIGGAAGLVGEALGQ